MQAALPARPEARRYLVGVLMSAIGRGLTLPFLLIYLTEVRHLSTAQAALVIGWYGAVVLLLSPVGGILVDNFGARSVAMVFLLAEATGTGSLAAVHSFPAAVAAVSLIALGSSAVWAAMTAFLSSVTDEVERQRTFGLDFTLLNLGIGVGGLIAGTVADVNRPVTFQLLYLIDAMSFLGPVLILLTMPRPVRTHVRRAAEGPEPDLGGYRAVLRHRPFRRLVIFALLITTCGYGQLEAGFPAFAVGVARVEPRVVAWALAGNAATIVLAQLLVIRWLEERSRSIALAGAGLLFGTAWLTLGLGGPAGSTGAVVCVVGCAVIFAFGETLLSPLIPALTNAIAVDGIRGRYNSLNSMTTGISGVIGPVTAGPLIGSGYGALWVALIVTGCATAATVALTLRRLLTPAEDGRFTHDRPAYGQLPGHTPGR